MSELMNATVNNQNTEAKSASVPDVLSENGYKSKYGQVWQIGMMTMKDASLNSCSRSLLQHLSTDT